MSSQHDGHVTAGWGGHEGLQWKSHPRLTRGVAVVVFQRNRLELATTRASNLLVFFPTQLRGVQGGLGRRQAARSALRQQKKSQAVAADF